jgi:ferrous iron transport protein A
MMRIILDINMTSPVQPENLAQADIGDPLLVERVSAPAHSPEWAQWLEEIGFLPGEPVRVMARGLPGADPLVIRVGDSTFALRRAEAECVAVTRDAA